MYIELRLRGTARFSRCERSRLYGCREKHVHPDYARRKLFQYYEKDQTYKPRHRIKNITRPKVATQVRSTTISIHPYKANLRIFFDMAGLAETRGKDFEM